MSEAWVTDNGSTGKVETSTGGKNKVVVFLHAGNDRVDPDAVDGNTFEEVDRTIARTETVQHELQREAEAGALIARDVMSWHRYSGDSRITGPRKGDIDWYVDLNDERGQKAAGAIEFGHTTKSGEFVPGVGALHTAFNLKGGDEIKTKRKRRT